jgi:hypothetical protein
MKMIQTGILSFTAAVCLMGITAPTEATLVIRDQCNQTSGDGQGHSCPGANDLLIRPRYENGTCGDWMCCPPNPDGKTYDCAHATNPTSSVVSGVLKNLLGPRATVINPGTGPGTGRQQRFPGTLGTIQPRGVEGEQPAEPTPGAPTSPEPPSGTKPQ